MVKPVFKQLLEGSSLFRQKQTGCTLNMEKERLLQRCHDKLTDDVKCVIAASQSLLIVSKLARFVSKSGILLLLVTSNSNISDPLVTSVRDTHKRSSPLLAATVSSRSKQPLYNLNIKRYTRLLFQKSGHLNTPTVWDHVRGITRAPDLSLQSHEVVALCCTERCLMFLYWICQCSICTKLDTFTLLSQVLTACEVDPINGSTDMPMRDRPMDRDSLCHT